MAGAALLDTYLDAPQERWAPTPSLRGGWGGAPPEALGDAPCFILYRGAFVYTTNGKS